MIRRPATHRAHPGLIAGITRAAFLEGTPVNQGVAARVTGQPDESGSIGRTVTSGMSASSEPSSETENTEVVANPRQPDSPVEIKRG